MATYTENYSLVKPGYGDQADIDVLNRLMTDKVDALLFENRRISADEYDQERQEPYKVDELAIFENVLYKCLEPTSGNFDPSKWEMTNLSKEVATKGEGGADVTKTASGNPIEISDAASAPMVKCVTAITGSQDLHGYDKPWVGGSGKNKLPLNIGSMKAANTGGTWSGNDYLKNGITFKVNTDNDGNVISITLSGTASATIVFVINTSFGVNSGNYIINGCPTGGSANTYKLDTRDTSTAIYYTDYGSGESFEVTETGNYESRIVVYNGASISNLAFYPMIRLATVTDPTFAPYSNICPITAYTEGEIEVRGKNLFDKNGNDVDKGYMSDKYIAILNNQEEFYTPSSGYWYVSEYIQIESSTQYVLSGLSTNDSNAPCLSMYDENKNFINGIVYQNARQKSITTPSNAKFIRISVGPLSDSSDNIQLEKGKKATPYEPYLGTTHTTTYPSAIYRGSEDVVNGEVTKERTCISLTDLTWEIRGEHTLRATLSEAAAYVSSYTKVNAICSNYNVTAQNGSTAVGNRVSFNTATQIYLIDLEANFTDNQSVSDRLSGATLAYPLATPTTSSVTPTNLPIKSLSGYTHIESSTGDMEVEYITEEFQPIVDLIQSNSGKHEYSTNEQVVGTWTDGSTLYQKTIIFDNVITLASDTFTDVYDLSTLGVKDLIELTAYTDNTTPYRPFCHYFTDITSANVLRLNPVGNGWQIGGMTIRYTKTTPTRSLNLTKSAVEDIPDEIKNAPFEEKPDYNEADDDAPTEVDER